MKFAPLPLILCLAATLAVGQTTTRLGDWAVVTAPATYQTGVPFDVEVAVKEVASPSRLVIAGNYLTTAGAFGGFLQMFGVDEAVGAPVVHTFQLTITQRKPDLGSASLVVYLSPDGSWSNRTQHGVVSLKPVSDNGPIKAVESRLVAVPENRTGQNPFSRFATFPKDKGFFPIGVWAQNPRDAGAYQALGVNFYYGLHGGPTPEQMAGLRTFNMPAVCHYNAFAKENLRDDPLIWAWMHPDEPDLAIAYPRTKLKAPGGKEIIKSTGPRFTPRSTSTITNTMDGAWVITR